MSVHLVRYVLIKLKKKTFSLHNYILKRLRTIDSYYENIQL